MNYDINRLTDGLAKLNISFDDLCIRRFMDYYEMLVEWNERINLTSITDYEDVVLKHFLDSLALLDHIHVPKKASLIDIGTGAGFPGIPLKIARPDLKVMLVDSLHKRLVFLDHVIDKLGLDDIDTYHSRAEDLGHDHSFREQYDLCVSRAVADLSVLCEYALPFVKPGGVFVSYKSGDIDSELLSASSAITTLSAEFDHVDRYVLPGSDINRSLVFIRKTDLLDDRFPRNAARIKKNRL
ncbi:MAG: 16S rRNA (guanine(527)-N(7))-methyltransferase RsmG [Lachnospiraceae bacterium]|nr:16S rRNA (guanine(527)-N(7))-methyltransferase RsmG [Lachnospiraceae bacterium]